MIFLSELAIAWFWFMGTAVFCLILSGNTHILQGGSGTVLFLLGMVGIGLVVGGILSDRLGVRRTEPGLIPLGAIGMSLFAPGLQVVVDALCKAGSLCSFS